MSANGRRLVLAGASAYSLVFLALFARVLASVLTGGAVGATDVLVVGLGPVPLVAVWALRGRLLPTALDG